MRGVGTAVLWLALGGLVDGQTMIYQARPVYPPLAMQARIEGVVRLVVVVGEDGRVKRVKLISGHPFLVDAAMEAVKKWRYRPKMYNGVPAESAIVVSIPFTINRN